MRHVHEPGTRKDVAGVRRDRWLRGPGDYGGNRPFGTVITNVTAAYDAESLMYHIRDYSFGTFYEAWGLFNEQKIYTYSPENIPGPFHCTCLPSTSESYLPEFYSLANASLKSANSTIPGSQEKVNEWVVHGEILQNDTYSVWVLANSRDDNNIGERDAIPVRTVWVDPGPTKAEDTVEQSDYRFIHIGNLPNSEFTPNEACLKVSC